MLQFLLSAYLFVAETINGAEIKTFYLCYVKKKLVLFCFSIIVFFLVWNWQIVVYGFQQAIGQFSMMSRTISVADMIKDSLVADSIKTKLRWVAEIKQFAQDSLGLAATENYTAYYEQNGDPILWIVTACPPYSMEEFQWAYPVLGELGYKGYFRKELADIEADKLSKEGYDVDVGVVNAWSTLGWLQDPVLSSMMKMTEGELARLLIHELTHTTFYIPDSANFNENLATFIGDKGAQKYMKEKYGIGSKQLVNYQNHLSDLKKLATHFLGGSKQLSKLYNKLEGLNAKQKRKLKDQQIKLIMANLDTVNFSSESKFVHIRSNSFMPNNTFFNSYQMYRGEQQELDSVFINKCNGYFPMFVNSWK